MTSPCSCGECYACGLRAKGIAIAPSATPTRVSCRPPVVRPMREPSWEKGRVGERRPDGSFMPVLSPLTGRPMTIKERSDLGASRVERGIANARRGLPA